METIVFPKDFLNSMEDMLKEEFPLFKESFQKNENQIGIRINSLKLGAKEAVLSKIPNAEQVKWCENGYYADKSVLTGKHPYHISGLIYFQEPSAMSTVSALDIRPGEMVLDLCAAPGGKATQAGEMLKNKGLLVANEIVYERAKILSENIERIGIENALVLSESPEKLERIFPEFFDKIIMDAPCSGEGMFRKEPKALTEWSKEHSESCAIRQKHIADSAVKMLKPGGKLIYSTCTFSKCENEDVAEYISSIEDMELLPISLPLSDGFDEKGYTKRVFPHREKGEGHFIALFQKNGKSENAEAFYKQKKFPKEFEEFARDFLKELPSGNPVLFGDRLYLMPYDMNLNKLKVLRCGLYLGEIRKGRFIPSHALALSSLEFKNTLELPLESEEIKKYLHGETIPCEKNGWVKVTCDSFAIGLGKASGGVLKNHFPKYLRII
ncbi:MAG: RsmF rRNA methyltransferase first C-terminal domain-containing protein [Clostridia bacterium]|nr:RsmF rRNA methyltransferase first C-terminal domain-containing protein [Clostridia bacterium]